MSNPDRRIHEAWRSYRLAVVPPGLNDEAAVDAIRDAFYAGAGAALRELGKAARSATPAEMIRDAAAQMGAELAAYVKRKLDPHVPK